MNPFRTIISYVPAMLSYLRGQRLFQEHKYNGAIREYQKCIKHPKFQNELLFSSYGQALCAAGRLDDGHEYLLKACRVYEENGWEFNSSYTYNLAKETLSALKHVTVHISNDEGKQFLSRELQLTKE